jgi:TorA maturation chaperone TorD
MVVGIGYFLYILKDKDVKFKEDYFGTTYNILGSLQEVERNTENVKKIIRLISQAVLSVEKEHKYEDNKVKEHKALKLARESLKQLNLTRNIDEYSMIYIIRISAAMMPKTNKCMCRQNESLNK